MGYSEIAAFTRAFTRRFGKSSGCAISTQSLASVLPSLKKFNGFPSRLLEYSRHKVPYPRSCFRS
jgi:hypothetical protein